MSSLITSPNNQYIKDTKKLRLKKFRDKENKFIIESKKLIDEAVRSDMDLDFILLAESCHLEEEYPRSYRVKDSLFKSLSNMQSPDGVLAVGRKKEEFDPREDKILVMDRIQDPGNAGSLIRSAEAFGFRDIILIDSVDVYNDKALRASMGSSFRLNCINKSYGDLEDLRSLGYKIYSADMAGEDYRKEDYSSKLILVIGNEGQGISRDIEKILDRTIKIPMQGEIESLNAAISGSIIMSEISSR